jgi:hypothetical protein
MKETGGPAFPEAYNNVVCGVNETEYSPGMTLRDYFAIHASENDMKYYSVDENGETFRPEVARYAFADAMLKQRDNLEEKNE